MIKAYVGSGGKTTSIFKEKDRLLKENKTVLICTSTNMLVEKESVLSSDFDEIMNCISKNGYCMAGVLKDNGKMGPLDMDLYYALCDKVDEVLIEADGSRMLPLKVTNENEPVIYRNADEIVLIGGCRALYKPLKTVCHRYELLDMDENTIVTPEIFQMIYRKYKQELKEKYPEMKISYRICQTSSLFEQIFASLIEFDKDVNCIDEAWFDINQHLYIFGAGHVGQAVSQLASFMEYHVHVYDERKDLIDEVDFSHCEEAICDSFENIENHVIPNSYYVVMTPKHSKDYEVVKHLLHIPYRYLGMIGSKKKVAFEFDKLKKVDGISDETLSSIHAPIGLKIGSQSPKEIAISILAEIIQTKNTKSKASISTHLYESNEDGVLCIVVNKTGSAPRGIGSMMLVTKDKVIDTVGGGTTEFLIINDALKMDSICTKEYFINEESIGVCGGSQTILFIPIKRQNAM